MGRFVHFDPVQIGTQSTQLGRCLSSAGIRQNFGRRNLGGAWGPILAADAFTVAVKTGAWAVAGATMPVSIGAAMLASCVRTRSILACAVVTVSEMLTRA